MDQPGVSEACVLSSACLLPACCCWQAFEHCYLASSSDNYCPHSCVDKQNSAWSITSPVTLLVQVPRHMPDVLFHRQSLLLEVAETSQDILHLLENSIMISYLFQRLKQILLWSFRKDVHHKWLFLSTAKLPSGILWYHSQDLCICDAKASSSSLSPSLDQDDCVFFSMKLGITILHSWPVYLVQQGLHSSKSEMNGLWGKNNCQGILSICSPEPG